MSNNHYTWAKYYDEVNRECFGTYYDQLTDLTLREIEKLGTGLSIIDYGAGTGRLSIPLSEKHNVVAVEPSTAMMNQLKIKDTISRLISVESSIHQYQCPVKNDLALVLFTVISYILTEDQLKDSFQNVADSLKQGGRLLIDVPQEILFRNSFRETNILRRDIKFKELGNGVYEYSESTKIREYSYTDTFKLRLWSTTELQSALEAAGLVIEKDLSSNFPMAGAYYWLCRKK
jgi:SAM-dependent methyltransferase